jgi:hypothetical protein
MLITNTFLYVEYDGILFLITGLPRAANKFPGCVGRSLFRTTALSKKEVTQILKFQTLCMNTISLNKTQTTRNTNYRVVPLVRAHLL